jgi:hypothetical protein
MKPRLVAPLLALGLFLVACADAPRPGPGDGAIDHGTAPDDLLVRVAYEGGFTPLEWTYTNVPVFSLYGDGTLVVPGAQIAIYPGPALPALSRRTVEEGGVQAILEEVLGAVRSLPADLDDLGNVAVADAATTVITVSAGGVDRTIRAYALGELMERPEGMPADVFRARRGLHALVEKLTALEPWLPAGSLGPETAYDAAAARLFVGDYRPAEDLQQTPVAWPLDGSLADFGAAVDAGGYRCGTVGEDAWSAVRTAASGANELTPWTEGRSRYSILFRPLLPDESGC